MTTERTAADAGLTRRAIVQGVGALAGATVLAASTATAGAAAAAPVLSAASGPTPPSADAVTAGLTYDTYIGFSFLPLGQPLTDVVSTLTGVYVPGVNASFYVPVNLPSGSVVKELSLAGSNSSGVIQTLGLYAQPYATTGGQLLGSASLVSGDTSLRSISAPLSHVIDGDLGYYLLVTTRGDGTQNAHGARLGYTAPGAFTPLPVPIRIYDSRPAGLPAGGVKGKFANHEERVLDAHLGTGVPYGASSVLVNVAATNTNPGGFFSLFRNGVAWPGTSTLNWGVANTTVSSLAATQVAGFGNFKARCEAPGGADLIVDVVGWFS
jgi:hypothetical protein